MPPNNVRQCRCGRSFFCFSLTSRVICVFRSSKRSVVSITISSQDEPKSVGSSRAHIGQRPKYVFALILVRVFDIVIYTDFCTDTGPVRKSDLKNDLHKFFHRQRWRVEESEYKALLPSMRLASHLIEVSMPYLSSFLPSDQIHDGLTPIAKNADRSASGYTITVDDDASQADLTEARAELDTVAGHVEWVVNYEMYRTLGWIGITRAVHDAPRPWGELAAKEILDKDEELKNRGLRRRLLTIGIMGEYVLALRQLPSNSEAHLRATFLAAITMTHEIGHAVFHQDYRSIDLAGDHGYEPWVGNDCWAELGLSYIGWIFGGYNPNPCETGTVDHAWSFHYPIAWFKQFTVDEQPLYETAYSIGIQYLEEVLSTEFWDSLGDPNTPNFSANAKNKLKALTASNDQQPATAILPQWKYTKSQGLLWKFRFNDRRVGERPKVGKEVSEEEIEWEKDQFRVRYPHKNATLWNDKPNPRLNMRDDDDEDEDEDEEFGFGASSRNAVSNTGRNLNKLKEADLPPREIDDGFIQPDLSKDNDPGAAALTRVEVRYRPQIVVTPPDDDEKENFGYVAPRPDDDEDNDEQFGGKVGLPSNKPALRRNDPEDPDKDERFDKENYDANDIRAALYNKREYRVAKMSHKQAFKYCQLRNIRFGFTYEDDETWQKSYLDLDIDEERGLCQRIIQYSLRRLERSDRFKDDYAAIVQIKEWGSRIDNWEDKDLVEFCQFQGMSAGGDKRDRKARVQNWLKRDINVAKAELAKRDAATVTSQALVVVDRSDNPENWSQVMVLSCSISPFSRTFFPLSLSKTSHMGFFCQFTPKVL